MNIIFPFLPINPHKSYTFDYIKQGCWGILDFHRKKINHGARDDGSRASNQAGSADLLSELLRCVNFLLSLSISLRCERAVSIMPQVHIKEMGAGWYLQLSLLTQPWASRC